MKPVELRRFALARSEYAVLAVPFLDDETSPLTPSEREVALAAAVGSSNAEIARRRGVAERTVANQLAAIYRKLCIHSRWELVSLMVRGRRDDE